MDALTELLAKVEAGKGFMWTESDVFCDPHLPRHVQGAFAGSLDAAKALHEAVLPGYSQYSIVTDPMSLCVKVAWWPDGLSGEREIHGEGWSESNPARAWLIAVLMALIAEAEEC